MFLCEVRAVGNALADDEPAPGADPGERDHDARLAATRARIGARMIRCAIASACSVTRAIVANDNASPTRNVLRWPCHASISARPPRPMNALVKCGKKR